MNIFENSWRKEKEGQLTARNCVSVEYCSFKFSECEI